MTPCPACHNPMHSGWSACSDACDALRLSRELADARTCVFTAAALVLDINPAPELLVELAGMCTSVDDALAAVKAMRDAPEFDRVAAGLRFLGDRRKDPANGATRPRPANDIEGSPV